MLRPFKRPDLHAPRFRASCCELLNKGFYDQARRAHKDLADFSDAAIKDVIKKGCSVIQEKVIALRDGVELPEQLGFLFIGSTSATKNRNVDYKRSIELGQEVRHKSWETDELTGKIFYTNYETKYRFKFHELWRFSAVRQFKRAVSRAYLLRFTDYVKVDKWLKVSWMFRRK